MPEVKSYTIGGAVEAESGYYIERRADTELLEACRAGMFAYILAPRQTGKSSLVNRTVERLLTQGTRCSIVDLTAIGTLVTPDQWFAGLLQRVAEDLELSERVDTWWNARGTLGVTDRMVRFFTEVVLVQVNDPVVIFIDEIDTTLSLDFTDDFFAAIRYFYNARPQHPEYKRLTFVLIGVAQPEDLIQSSERTPFNIGVGVKLQDFTQEEARPLAGGLGLPTSEAERVLGWVLDWTGGHPFLTQRLCGEIAQVARKEGPQPWQEPDVVQLVHSLFFGKGDEQDKNIRFVREMLTEKARPDVFSVLETYEQIRTASNPVPDEERSRPKAHLKLSGVVRAKDGFLHVRNRIYAEVFDLSWIRQYKQLNAEYRVLAWRQRRLAVGVALIVTVAIAALFTATYTWGLFRRANRQYEDATFRLQQARDAAARAETAKAQAVEKARQADSDLKQAIVQRKLREREGKAARIAEQQAEAKLRAAGAALDSTRRGLLLQQQRASVLQTKSKEIEAKRKFVLAQSLLLRAEQFRSQNPPKIALSDLLACEATRHDTSSRTANLLYSALATLPRCLARTPLDLHPSKSPNTHPQFVLSPDGSLVIALQSGADVPVLDSRSGKILSRLRPPSDVQLYRFSDDGNSLALASYTDRWVLTVWETRTGKKRVDRAFASGTTYRNALQNGFPVALGPHGSQVATITTLRNADGQTTGSDLEVWDVRQPNRTTLRTKIAGPAITALAFSPDGRYLALGNSAGTVTMQSTSNQSDTWMLPEHQGGSVTTLTFSADGFTLASGSADKTVHLWYRDLWYGDPFSEKSSSASSSQQRTQKLGQQPTSNGTSSPRSSPSDPALDWTSYTAMIKHDNGVASVALSPTGFFLATTDANGVVRVWSLGANDPPLQVILDAENPASSVVFCQDGSRLRTTDSTGIREWDVCGGQTPHLIVLERTQITLEDLAVEGVSQDRGIVTIKNGDRADIVGMWPLCQETPFPISAATTSLAISNGGSYIATTQPLTGSKAGGGSVVQAWNRRTGKSLVRWTLPTQQTDMAFSPDSRYFATHDSTKTTIWDLRSKHGIATLPGTSDTNSYLVFSPDSRRIAIEDQERWQLFDIGARRMLAHGFVPNGGADFFQIAFSPNGAYLGVMERDANVAVLEAHTGKRLRNIPVSSDSLEVAFHPKQDLIAIAGDSTTRMVDIRTGKETMRVPIPYADFIGFSPAGDAVYANEFLLSTHALGFQQQVFPLKLEALRREVQARLPRRLTPQEWNDYVPGEPYPGAAASTVPRTTVAKASISRLQAASREVR